MKIETPEGGGRGLKLKTNRMSCLMCAAKKLCVLCDSRGWESSSYSESVTREEERTFVPSDQELLHKPPEQGKPSTTASKTRQEGRHSERSAVCREQLSCSKINSGYACQIKARTHVRAWEGRTSRYSEREKLDTEGSSAINPWMKRGKTRREDMFGSLWPFDMSYI